MKHKLILVGLSLFLIFMYILYSHQKMGILQGAAAVLRYAVIFNSFLHKSDIWQQLYSCPRGKELSDAQFVSWGSNCAKEMSPT